jgi:asparagine synthase (glutamine-hydrolysing)
LDRERVLTEFAAQHELEVPERANGLRALQRFDIATYLNGDLLTKEDRASMSVGLECRVPMLDDDLIGVAERTPDAQKISLWSGKRPLRALAGRRLPGDVARGRKRGFAVPLGDLLAGRWRAGAHEWLRALPSGLVDGPRAANALVDGTAGSRDLWLLTALAGWEARLKRERMAHRLPR